MIQRPPPVRCPGCKRALVNRLFDYCLYCCVMLPNELRLTEEQKDDIKQRDRAQMTEDRRLREAQTAEENEEQAKKMRHSLSAFNIMLFLP